jgi:hypothetical protein
MEVGFALEIQDKIEKIGRKLVDGVAIEFKGDLTGISGKFPKSGGAFRAAKVAGSSRLDRHRERVTGMPDTPGEAAKVIAQKYFRRVNDPARRQPRQEPEQIEGPGFQMELLFAPPLSQAVGDE